MKSKIEHYKDLEVWQRAFRLCIQVAKKYEQHELAQTSYIIRQLIEKSTQVPALISEGFLRGVLPEYVSCLKNARHIVAEIDTTFQILPELNLSSVEELEELTSEYEIVARQISTLTSILAKKLPQRNHSYNNHNQQTSHQNGNHHNPNYEVKNIDDF